jgi:RecA/RadA recombinase
MMAAYLRDNPDAVAILYDSENGASIRYMQTYGVDMSRVFYERIDNVEDLRKKVITRLVDLDESDKVFFFVDSLGQLGSLKELNDTLTKDDLPSDMGIRAKSITSFFRIVTPILTRLKLPMYIINHYYESMGVKYPQKQIKGGQQAYLSSENIWIITSVKDKNTDNKIEGYTFNIYIEKSRKVKEGVTIPIEVKYNEDISEYSGLFEIAKRMGWIEMVSSGWYSRKLLDIETGELKLESKKQRKGEVEYDDSFWKPLLSNESFKQDVRETFTLHGKMMAENFAITEFEIVKPDL